MGAAAGVAITFFFVSESTERKISNSRRQTILQSSVFDVDLDDKKLTSSNSEYPDLTLAAEHTVASALHIQKKVVTEEVTFDPFLKLFYGEDGYRKRQRHGQASGSGVVIS
jgi:hypothetical protein